MKTTYRVLLELPIAAFAMRLMSISSFYSFVTSRWTPQSAVSEHLLALASITMDEIAEGLDNRHFTSVDLARADIARIEEAIQVVNAVLEVGPDALNTAADLDKERGLRGRRGGARGANYLHALTHLD